MARFCSDLVRCQPAQCAALGCCISISIIFVASYFMASRMSTSIVLISCQNQDGPYLLENQLLSGPYGTRTHVQLNFPLTINNIWLRDTKESNLETIYLSVLANNWAERRTAYCGVLWNRTIVTGLSNLHPKPLNELPNKNFTFHHHASDLRRLATLFGLH